MFISFLKKFLVFITLLFMALSTSVLPVSAKQDLVIDPLLFDINYTDRIILVTYSDKHIKRIPVGQPNHAYRKRGEYGNSSWSQRVAASIEADYKLKMLTQWSISEIGEHCVVYLINENQSMAEIITALSNDNRIDNVQLMSTFKVLAEEYSDPYYRLQSSIHPFNLEKIHSQTTGKNVTIAIIDTGVDIKHPDLEGQVNVIKDFVTHQSTDFSSDGHGTAIAGIIAAKANNGQGIVGLAPDSRIVAMKACWEVSKGNLDAVCNSFTLALALNTAIDMKVDVINLSLTGPHDPLLARLIDTAVRQGIIVIASQTDRQDDKSGFPAQQPGVIGVQSHNHMLQTSYKTQAQIVPAPGEQILTTLPNGAYDFISGNSMATAHVTGLAALLLQLERGLTNQDLYKLLVKADEPKFYELFNTNSTKLMVIKAGHKH
ncbi:MAG: S8 family serine peptidase [Burkholderiales bacterium]|nr:S8 family serine peptidase [Nitrosomonas sp.]MCP5274552.1 S8 family serine peptidase [Burkholderiales bacterium]